MFTLFLERHTGSYRNRNARKTRMTYCFSNDSWARAVIFFGVFHAYETTKTSMRSSTGP